MILHAEKGAKGKEFPNQELVGAVIGAAVEVHRALGPGFLESIDEKALCVELERVGLAFEAQKLVPVFSRGQLVGNRILVELKATKALEPIHFSIVRSSLKALDLGSALVFNFATTPLSIRRVDVESSSSDVA